MKRDTRDAARGRWKGILTALGVEERFLRNRHGPCPICGGKDKFRFDDKNGEGTWFCNFCRAGDGFTLIQGLRGCSFQEAAKLVDEVVGNAEYRAPRPVNGDPVRRRQRLTAIWRETQSMDSPNAARRYLKGRGLQPSPATRFHPGLTYFEDGRAVGVYPAMVHRLQLAGGKPLTLHVTYLTEAGEKAPVESPKKILPPLLQDNGEKIPFDGCAIRLFKPGRHIGIAEGIETAMAARTLYDIPVWASYSADLLAKWQPPAGTELVTIFADKDESFTGQMRAYELAWRLRREGFGVRVLEPEVVGTDFADLIKRESA